MQTKPNINGLKIVLNSQMELHWDKILWFFTLTGEGWLKINIDYT